MSLASRLYRSRSECIAAVAHGAATVEELHDPVVGPVSFGDGRIDYPYVQVLPDSTTQHAGTPLPPAGVPSDMAQTKLRGQTAVITVEDADTATEIGVGTLDNPFVGVPQDVQELRGTGDVRWVDIQKTEQAVTIGGDVASFDVDAWDRMVGWDEAASELSGSAEVETFNITILAEGPDGSDDPRLRETVESLADVFDIDVDAAAKGELDAIEADDVAEEDIATAKATLADLVLLATVTWDGERVAAFDRERRRAYREAIAADPPEGWGLAGLMDAWGEIQYAVEKSRDDRLERVQKFRDTRRRGDR